MISIALLQDCMEYMATVPDKWFELAVVDVQYGINAGNMALGKGGGVAKSKNYKHKDWDKSAPDATYFDLLKRKSKNQIIWGANHFIDNMPFNISSPCWIIWDKQNGLTDYADCEIAWTSFDSPIRKFTFKWSGMLQGDMKNKQVRIHPTEKPIALYRWIYANYLPNGGKVFDSHLGSGSNRIAADKAGNIDFYSTEIDPDYFAAQEKRWLQYKSQAVISFPERIEPVQIKLL